MQSIAGWGLAALPPGESLFCVYRKEDAMRRIFFKGRQLGRCDPLFSSGIGVDQALAGAADQEPNLLTVASVARLSLRV